jgi:hypothetical protein
MKGSYISQTRSVWMNFRICLFWMMYTSLTQVDEFPEYESPANYVPDELERVKQQLWVCVQRLSKYEDVSEFLETGMRKSESMEELKNIWEPVKREEERKMNRSLSGNLTPTVSMTAPIGGMSASTTTTASIPSTAPPMATIPPALSSMSLNMLNQGSTSTLFEQKELKTTFKALIDKIIKTNDQPCSIFLQQRLRLDPTSRVYIFQGVQNSLLQLTKNRFGNFLVQCCFEFANQEQLSNLVAKMKGHVVTLGCDRFGCHVMQKVLIVNQGHGKM